MADTTQIPPFNESGLLPPDIYSIPEDAFESRFVDAIPDSHTRAPIFRGFRQWRADASEQSVANAVQWIDGSFVESKVNPNDIDVATFIHYDRLNTLPVRAHTFVESWMKGHRAYDKYNVDTHFAAYCEPTHKYYEIWQSKLDYLKDLFGTTREDYPKGFVEVLLGNEDESRHTCFEVAE